MTKNIINIGLPSKGRLKHDTINIFKEKKLNIYSERGERDLFGYIKKLSNVKYVGFVDPTEYYQKADVFIFPSLFESHKRI